MCDFEVPSVRARKTLFLKVICGPVYSRPGPVLTKITKSGSRSGSGLVSIDIDFEAQLSRIFNICYFEKKTQLFSSVQNILQF
jgi:hypothetical protein